MRKKKSTSKKTNKQKYNNHHLVLVWLPKSFFFGGVHWKRKVRKKIGIQKLKQQRQKTKKITNKRV